MITSESIKKFKELYKKLYGEEIDDLKAKEQGGRLINFVKIVMEAENAVRTYKLDNQKGV